MTLTADLIPSHPAIATADGTADAAGAAVTVRVSRVEHDGVEVLLDATIDGDDRTVGVSLDLDAVRVLRDRLSAVLGERCFPVPF